MDEKLETLMADILRLKQDEVTDSLSFTQCERWNSLRHMELVVAIEDQFAIQLSADDIIAMQNVKEIKRILREKGVGE